MIDQLTILPLALQNAIASAGVSAANWARVLTLAAFALRSCSSNIALAIAAAEGIGAASGAAATALTGAGAVDAFGLADSRAFSSARCAAARVWRSLPLGAFSQISLHFDRDIPKGVTVGLLDCIDFGVRVDRRCERAASSRADLSRCDAGCVPVARKSVRLVCIALVFEVSVESEDFGSR